MDISPKILVVTDEPMMMVDMLSELEDRGFSVEHMKPGNARIWLRPNSIDAAVFDLHRPDERSLQFASKLRLSRIPIVSLDGRWQSSPVRIAGAQICLSRPVDYDRLAELLFELASRRFAFDPRSSAGIYAQADALSADGW